MLEMIKVRTQINDPGTVIDQITSILNESLGREAYQVFKNFSIQTDYLILIEHDLPNSSSEESSISRDFQFKIQDLGMSAYSKWLPVDGTQSLRRFGRSDA